MNNLGCFYKNTGKNSKVIKYYNDHRQKNVNTMYNLGNYYYYTEKNYFDAKKYLLMAVNGRDSDAMFDLGNHYKRIENNYNKIFFVGL